MRFDVDTTLSKKTFTQNDVNDQFADALEQLRPQLRADAANIADELLGKRNRAMSTKREIRYGTNGSVSVNPDKGVWEDFDADEGGDMLDLFMSRRHLSFFDAVRECCSRYGISITGRTETAEVKERRRAQIEADQQIRQLEQARRAE